MVKKDIAYSYNVKKKVKIRYVKKEKVIDLFTSINWEKNYTFVNK